MLNGPTLASAAAWSSGRPSVAAAARSNTRIPSANTAPDEPVPAKRDRESHLELDIRGLDRPRERRLKVLLLRVEQGEGSCLPLRRRRGCRHKHPRRRRRTARRADGVARLPGPTRAAVRRRTREWSRTPAERLPRRRTRLWSASDVSRATTSSPTTASASSIVQPPANTERSASVRCPGSSSSSKLQSRVARIVCCRAGRS